MIPHIKSIQTREYDFE